MADDLLLLLLSLPRACRLACVVRKVMEALLALSLSLTLSRIISENRRQARVDVKGREIN